MRTYHSANTVHTQPSTQSLRERDAMNDRHNADRDRENIELEEEHARLGWR
jgi:hypothetical protein